MYRVNTQNFGKSPWATAHNFSLHDVTLDASTGHTIGHMR
jgi:hypothetical protein